MIRLRRERRLPAISFGTYPVRETTARTRSRVSGVTSSGWFRARDTVMGDTPATFATSRIVTALPIRTGRGRASGVSVPGGGVPGGIRAMANSRVSVGDQRGA